MYSFGVAQQLYRLTSMSLGAVFSIFKCVYFILVSLLISIGVPAATPLGVQALDLMWMEVTWCWLFLRCTYILYCPWYIGQFRSNTSPDYVCSVVFSGRADISLPELCSNYCITLPLRILWLKAKTFQCSAGCVLSPSVADWICVQLNCSRQYSGKPCLSFSYKTMHKFM